MDNRLTSDSFLLAIEDVSNNRFEIIRTGKDIDDLMYSAHELLIDKSVIKIRRKNNKKGGWRTVLIAIVANKNDFPEAIRWAADTRDFLAEPETSDLYLIIATVKNNVSIEEATKIESSEQFCRKYVLRQDEKPLALLNRTFFAPLVGADKSNSISDPLIAALKKTCHENPWFDENEQAAWREAFLSGKAGSDVIHDLFENLAQEGK